MLRTRSFRVMVISFLLVVVAAELTARALAPRLPEPQRWDTPFSHAKAEEAAAAGPVDIVVLGSSIANASIDVPLLVESIPWAEDGYNVALPSTTPRQWELWMRDVVLPDLCPQLLLIAIGVRDVNDANPGVDNRLRAYTSSSGRRALYDELSVAEQVDRWASGLSTFVALRERLREPANVYRYLRDGSAPGWPSIELSATGRYLGFDDRAYADNPERDDGLRRGALSDFTVGPGEFGALARIIEQTRAQGTAVALVDMPAMRTPLTAILDDAERDVADYEDRVASLVADTGVPLLQYPDLVDDPSLFADLYHMQLEGTLTISARLGEDLAHLVPEAPAARCAPRPETGPA